MIIWDRKENDDVSNDDLRLARHQRPLDGSDELPHADRPRAARRELDTWTEPVEEETLIESFLPGGSNLRIITPELVFFSIMTGFGLILIAGTLLGLVEVGP